MQHPRVILGGTFDPVHHGHLAIALAAATSLGVPDVALMPCYSPPHKSGTHAALHHRIAMIERAIADCNAKQGSQLWIERWEMQQTGPSWTAKTLEHFHASEQRPLILVMGMDSFCSLSTWRAPEQIMKLASVWIAQREDRQPEAGSLEAQWLHQNQVDSAYELRQGPGRLFVASNPAWACSSSQIRHELAARQTTTDVPKVVLQYIKKHQLYGVNTPPRSQ